MATWGGSSREIGKAKISALVANGPLLDGRFAPNPYPAHNHTDIDETNTETNTNTYANAGTSANTNINNSRNTNDDVADLDYIFRTLDPNHHSHQNPVPNIQNPIVNNPIPSRCSFPPPLNFPVNDSFFATVGDTLHDPFYTTPNTANYPLLQIGGIFQGTLFTPSRDTPLLPTPPTPALAPTTLGTAPALPQASAYQDYHSSFRLPGYATPRPNSYSFYGHSRIYQPRTTPNIQGNSQTSYPSATVPLSSVATAPIAHYQPHMSAINSRPIPLTSRSQCFPQASGAARSIDDDYLTALATHDFSSPSLPPLSSSPSPTALSPSGESRFTAEMPVSPARKRVSNRGGPVDLTKEEPDFESQNSSVDSSIPLATMPPTTRRQSLTGVADSAIRKRRPSAATSPSSRPIKARRKAPPIDCDDQPSPFDDDEIPGLNGHDGSETIDLSNATEVPAEYMAPPVDNRVKLSKFQCVICMDDTTSLTVTHCEPAQFVDPKSI
ncbi:hypothetical protein GQX73_g971 [Xylaria multiplex]|uniref:Uncharacterized protein n=1 Tax=Xylaria multiplex TaxID=323545 RepID=A0A7C8MVP6_9PEZI|nr:hypothetical protein GQX73_g971 [Xylaria multiplex]